MLSMRQQYIGSMFIYVILSILVILSTAKNFAFPVILSEAKNLFVIT